MTAASALIDPAPVPQPSLRFRGVEARRRGDHAEALRHFQAAALEAPGDPRLLNEIGAAAFAIGQVQAAEDAYALALAAKPDFVDAIRGLGHCARKCGDRRRALAYFEAAAAGSDDPRPRFEVAAERLALGGDAETAYGDLLADASTRPRACREVGRALERTGALVRAADWFEHAIAADPSDRSARIALAALRTRCWQLDRAATLYDGLLGSVPDDVEALLGHGALARRRGDRAAARASFAAAWRLDPRRGAVEWAREERDAGAHDRAFAILDQLGARQGADASLLVQLGLTARAAGDAAGAADRFAAALRLDPRHLSAHVEMADELHRLGRTVEARPLLASALAIWPDHPRLLESLGDLALAAEETEEAADLFRRAAARAPGQLSPICKLARGHAALGRPDDALAVLDAATATMGRSPDLTIVRAQILKEAGHLDEAAAAYRHGVAACPSSFALWLQASLFRLDWDRGEDLADLAPYGPAGTTAEAIKTNLVQGARAAAGWRFAEAQAWFERALDRTARDGAVHVRIAQAALGSLDLAAVDRHLARLSSLEAPTKRLRGQAVGLFQSLLGQILEEARLDIEALAHLLVAAAGPDEARLDGCLTTVRAFPEMTLASMQAAIEARRRGLFAGVAGGGPSPAIPRTIVQFWHEETLPPDLDAYCRTWQALNPDCLYRRFSERQAAAFIAIECADVVGRAFRRARDPAAKADLFRLAYLARHGGAYADIDDRCLASLADLRQGGAALILYQEDIGSIGNDVILAAPGHPLIGRALALASAAIIRGDCDIPWLSTGPGLLTRVVMQAAAQGGPTVLRDAGVAIIERRALLRYVATGCMTAYKSTRRHWSRAAFTKDRPRTDGSPPRPVAADEGILSDERRSTH